MTGKCAECGRSPANSDSESTISEVADAKKKKNVEPEEEEIDPYPEIQVPNEFQIQFETDKKMHFGSIITADRSVQDEMRIRYL